MEDIRKYNIRSIIMILIGLLCIAWMFIGANLNLPYSDDDFYGPIGVSIIIFGITRIFFRTLVKSVGRRVFGVWLIVFGAYCYIREIVFLPGIFGFLGGFIFVILGVVFIMVDF